MTNNVGLTFRVGDTYCSSKLVFSKTLRIDDIPNVGGEFFIPRMNYREYKKGYHSSISGHNIQKEEFFFSSSVYI